MLFDWLVMLKSIADTTLRDLRDRAFIATRNLQLRMDQCGLIKDRGFAAAWRRLDGSAA